VEYKNVRPSQAFLDPQNPRLPDGTSNDKEAINRLLSEGYEQLLALARDFVERGAGNPTELPILIKEGSKYIVLEGNRRFAALKLLADPKWADDPAHQQAFERIAKRGKPSPKSLYCAVAKDRVEADPWITLRHTGANNGVGVRTWSAEQNARHRARMRAPIDSGTRRSIAIADELTEAYQADTELVGLIKKVRTDKLTNIGRFFSGVTLTRMQFDFRQISDDDPQTLWAKHTATQLHPYFMWAFRFMDDNSVDAFKNDQVRGELLNNHGDLLPDAASSLAEHKRIADHPYSPENTDEATDDRAESDESGDDGDSSDDAGSSGGRSSDGEDSDGSGSHDGDDDSGSGRKRDKKDERCIYSEVKLPNISSNVQRLLKEAKQLPINDNYAIACVLARVILELAVSDPKVLKWSGSSEGATLASKINACLVKLDPDIGTKKHKRQDLIQAHLETSGIGVTYLHQFMHNPSAKADAQLARRFSAAYTPLLNSVNESLN
jgi:hypothetical protein